MPIDKTIGAVRYSQEFNLINKKCGSNVVYDPVTKLLKGTKYNVIWKICDSGSACVKTEGFVGEDDKFYLGCKDDGKSIFDFIDRPLTFSKELS